MHPRTRRHFHTVLALVGVFGATAGLLVAGVGARDGAPPMALGGAAMVVVAAAVVAFAYRRANALLHDEHVAEITAANAAAKRALVGVSATTPFVARVRPRTYVALAAACAIGAAGVAIGLANQAWVIGAIGLVLGIPFARMLGRAIRSPEALIVDWQGVHDRLYYGFIPWADIRSAAVHEDRDRRMGAATALELRLHDAAAYRARRDWLARVTLPAPLWRDGVLIQVGALDQPPRAVLGAMRQFHERAVPRGTIRASDTAYEVDDQGARRLELERRRDALLAALGEEAERAKDPAVKSDPAAASALVERMLAKSQEMDAVTAELDRLGNRRIAAFQRDYAQARRSALLPLLGLVGILAWLAYVVASRIIG